MEGIGVSATACRCNAVQGRVWQSTAARLCARLWCVCVVCGANPYLNMPPPNHRLAAKTPRTTSWPSPVLRSTG